MSLAFMAVDAGNSRRAGQGAGSVVAGAIGRGGAAVETVRRWVAVAMGCWGMAVGAQEIPSSDGGVAVIEHIAAAGPVSWEVRFILPAEHYLIALSAPGPDGPWTPFAVATPDGENRVVVRYEDGAGTAAVFFRGQAQPTAQPSDTDADGLDDLFELSLAGILNPVDDEDGLADWDGDGFSNRAEYLRGTDLAEAAAVESRRFPSLRALREAPPRLMPAQVYLAGYNAEGDGWGGWFAWKPERTESGDDAVVIALGDGRPGRLVRELQAEDPVIANWWRPPTDGVAYADDALRQAFGFLATRPRKKIILLSGRYRVQAYPTGYTELNRAPLYLSGLENFEIEGIGATLVSTEDGDLIVMENCRYGRVIGLGFEGPGSDRVFEGLNYACVNLHGYGSDLVFERCQFQGFMHGISHLFGEKNTVRVTIRECLFRDGGHSDYLTLGIDGAAISGVGSGWTVENCAFDDCARGVEIENVGARNVISQVMIRGNRMTNIRELGVMSFMSDFAGEGPPQSDIVIKDNVILGKFPRHRRANGQSIPVRQISLAGGVRCIVRGNICKDGDYSGISLMAVDADLSDCTISENVVEDCSGRGIQVFSQSGRVARDVQVVNNRVSRCSDRAILVRGENLFVRGNIIDVVAIAGIHMASPPEPASPTAVIWIRDNLVREVVHGAPAILVDPTPARVVVAGNDLVTAEIGIRDLSGSVMAGDNRYMAVGTPLVAE